MAGQDEEWDEAGREEDAGAVHKSVHPASDPALRDIFEAVLAAEDPAEGQVSLGFRV